MFEIWKSCQNLKHSTATTRQKKNSQLWHEMYTLLPKNICRSAKQLVEGCAERLFFFWFWHCRRYSGKKNLIVFNWHPITQLILTFSWWPHQQLELNTVHLVRNFIILPYSQRWNNLDFSSMTKFLLQTIFGLYFALILHKQGRLALKTSSGASSPME